MIEELKSYIKNDDFEGFKKAFSKATVNAHHRELLYEISFRKQSPIFEFMENKASVSPEKKIDIFIKTLKDGTKIKEFKSVQDLNDMLLSQNMKVADDLIKTQDDEFLKKFIDTYPMTTYMNFKRILFGSFKYNRDSFIDYTYQKNIDKANVFYGGLCAINFKRRESFSTLLTNTLKHNPNILDEVKQLKNEYKIVMRGRKTDKQKEEFEAFINDVLIETFAKTLSEELDKARPIQVGTVKQKRIKL
jgi:hypothetical protein